MMLAHLLPDDLEMVELIGREIAPRVQAFWLSLLRRF
jgi:hypothetical protein